MLPLLRADIEMANTYKVPDEEPLECPLTVFAGINDSLTCREGIMA
jgi:surfactin synthase thioesterase subunit